MLTGIKSLYSVCLGIIVFSQLLYAEVSVYPGSDDNLKSKKYFVRIFQDDNVYESFVFQGENPNNDLSSSLTDYNHWTTFSFNNEITIEITKLFGDPIRYCITRPKERNLKPEVSGHVVKIKINKPQMLCIELNEAEEDPLFIFADPPEEFIPDYNDKSIIYFSPGIYEIGNGYVVKNKDIYISGGALVYGSFIIEGDKPVKITGRGILSGAKDIQKTRNNELINITGSANQYYIDGITFTDPEDYSVFTNRPLEIQNAKFFGWSYHSKGVRSGDSSLIKRCFFKVDHDIFTLNSSNITIQNCVIWQQANGAPFQFSSYEKKVIQNIHINENDIIKIDIYEDEIWNSDKTIINCKELNYSQLKNVIIEGLRIEGNVHRLIGITTGMGGEIDGLTLKNIEIEGVLTHENYISAMKGSISNILFNNVEANYMKITNEYDAYIEKRGNVTDIKFLFRNY